MKYRVILNGDCVRCALLRRHLNTSDMATSLNISSGYLRQLMRGHRSPSPALRRRLAQTLDETFDALFTIVEQTGDNSVDDAIGKATPLHHDVTEVSGRKKMELKETLLVNPAQQSTVGKEKHYVRNDGPWDV